MTTKQESEPSPRALALAVKNAKDGDAATKLVEDAYEKIRAGQPVADHSDAYRAARVLAELANVLVYSPGERRFSVAENSLRADTDLDWFFRAVQKGGR